MSPAASVAAPDLAYTPTPASAPAPGKDFAMI